MRAPQRVFAPGAGAAPPALTGREREQGVLTQCLADLLTGNAPPHDVALMGPRGNGKTVLLNWFAGACRDAGRVDVARLSPSRMRTVQALAHALLPVSFIRKVLPRKLGVTGVGQAEWAAPERSAQDLVERLTARCRRRPVVALVDEAHTLTGEVGQLLLNLSQEVRAAAPFLLVLAGTPGLPAHLSTMDASFWSRLGGGRLAIGLLSHAAARAALVEPLAAHGVSIESGALDAVVEHSQRYPYFIQLWGEALWKQCTDAGGTRLTAASVDSARSDVTARITDYYQDRYRELESRGMLQAAVAVAPIFQVTAATATDHDLDVALAKTATAAGRLAAREELNRLGYIWTPPGQLPPVVWVAGIPSLMRYVLDHAPPPRPSTDDNKRDSRAQ